MDNLGDEENVILSNSKEEEKYKNNKKKKCIRLLYILIPLTLMLVAGIILYAVGQGSNSNPLMIVGGIVAGIGFIPLLVVCIVVWFKIS